MNNKESEILKLLLNQDLTQKEIAEKTGFSESTVSRLIKKLENHIELKPAIPPKKVISLKIDLNPFLKILNFTLNNFNEKEKDILINSKFYSNSFKNNEIKDFIFFILTPARNINYYQILIYLEQTGNEYFYKFRNFFNEKEKEKILNILSKSKTSIKLVFYDKELMDKLMEIAFTSNNKVLFDNKEYENMEFIINNMVKEKLINIEDFDIDYWIIRLISYKRKLIDFLESKLNEDLLNETNT